VCGSQLIYRASAGSPVHRLANPIGTMLAMFFGVAQFLTPVLWRMYIKGVDAYGNNQGDPLVRAPDMPVLVHHGTAPST
jgi:hypothetical protein